MGKSGRSVFIDLPPVASWILTCTPPFDKLEGLPSHTLNYCGVLRFHRPRYRGGGCPPFLEWQVLGVSNPGHVVPGNNDNTPRADGSTRKLLPSEAGADMAADSKGSREE